MQRPTGSNADEWALYLDDLLAAHEIPPSEIAFLSVQISEAIEAWHPIETAPKDQEIVLGMFRGEFQTPVVMNSCWVGGDERGFYWADWHGLPAPTHWRHVNQPKS